MAIYKLKELYSSNPEYGISAPSQNSGTYRYVRQSDIESKQFFTFVNEGPLLKNNDVLISRAGANSGASYLHTNGNGYVFAGFLVRYNFNQYLLLNKYFYYWTKSSYYINQISGVSKTGSTMPKLNPPVVGSLTINLPLIKEQQKIIDIIKPIETAIINIQKQILEVKKLLKSNYQLLKNEQIKFTSIINLATNKYNNQKYYLATNAIGECTIDESKAQDVSISRASRANLTPEIESIIFSKLDGENKVLYIGDDFKYVISTGFFNVETSYLDHVMGFLLSEDFKKQKSLLSTGTTMAGLNNSSLEKIMISRPNNDSKDLVNFLNELISIENSLKDELQKCISLLIK